MQERKAVSVHKEFRSRVHSSSTSDDGVVFAVTSTSYQYQYGDMPDGDGVAAHDLKL